MVAVAMSAVVTVPRYKEVCILRLLGEGYAVK